MSVELLINVTHMETRVALLSIIVENEDAVSELNELLHRYGKYIIGRMGIPYRQKDINIICKNKMVGGLT